MDLRLGGGLQLPDGGNHLSGYVVDPPMDTPDPLARFEHVRAGMQRCKAAGPARGAGAFPVSDLTNCELGPVPLGRLDDRLRRWM